MNNITYTKIRFILTIVLLAMFLISESPSYSQTTVNITFGKDNTLYQDNTGTTSNGSGQYLFTGKTVINQIRRGLVAFDLPEFIPPCAIVTNVTLRMHMSKTITGSTPVQLRRVLKDWGAGASDAFGEEGFGTAAEADDATWLHTFYPANFWDRPGGDYSDSVSAVTNVDAIGFYTWGSNSAMVKDVQDWVNDPNSNYGWILIADESTYPTAKRFDSMNHDSTELKPTLIVTYLNTSLTLSMNCLVEGFWNGAVTVKDTMRVTLRNTTSPYSSIETSSKYFNETGDANYCFSSASPGNYYLVVNHRNSIETWSKFPVTLSSGFSYYIFSDAASKAYNDNQVFKSGSYCIYSGDVNQDDIIEGFDVSMVDNDAAVFLTGYEVTDVNGDEIVDGSDLLITGNNASNFVTAETPP